MNKAELKKILKPLIKECINEVILEDGILSTIISEVLKGTSEQHTVMTEVKKPAVEKKVPSHIIMDRTEQKRKQLKEQKRKMLDAIGKGAYNGVNLFEGTTPMSSQGSQNSPHGAKALDGIAPNDPGVDLSSFAASGVWKKLAGN
tara:strand:- start:989 stop:1423 length:435 start_codon:yes stop_codon:yes gene_type:complete